jgi:hypothetical protein
VAGEEDDLLTVGAGGADEFVALQPRQPGLFDAEAEGKDGTT